MSVGPPGAELRHRLGTLIGRPRRRDLLERLVPNGVGAELGVFRGEFSRELLEVARPRRLYLVDGWWELHGESFPREWGEYSGWGSASTRDAYMAAPRVAAEYAPASTVCEIHVGDDLEFLAGLPDARLDWAYLDSSHQYEHTGDPRALRASRLAGRRARRLHSVGARAGPLSERGRHSAKPA